MQITDVTPTALPDYQIVVKYVENHQFRPTGWYWSIHTPDETLPYACDANRVARGSDYRSHLTRWGARQKAKRELRHILYTRIRIYNVTVTKGA